MVYIQQCSETGSIRRISESDRERESTTSGNRMEQIGLRLGRGAAVGWSAACILLLSETAHADAYCQPSAAQPADTTAVGRVVSAEGAELRHAFARDAAEAIENSCLYLGTTMVTDGQGRLTLELTPDLADRDARDASVMRIGPSARLTLKQKQRERSQADWVMELRDGWFKFFSGRKVELDVDTPFITAGVKGTEFALYTDNTDCAYYDAGGKGCSALFVREGAVDASLSYLTEKDYGKIEASKIPVIAGDSERDTVIAVDGTPPRYAKLTLTPEDAVNWSLYYPALMRTGTERAGLAGKDSGSVDGSVSASAIRLLREGKVERARKLLSDATNAEDLALRSVLALKDNDKAEATRLAALAVDIDESSADAQLALSYALQAAFDLQGAADATDIAAKNAPDEPLILARQAELALAQQDVAAATNHAGKAVALALKTSPQAPCAGDSAESSGGPGDPILSRAYAVQGYAQLVGLDAANAHASFDKARCADGLSPLAYLGLGLAAIRSGRLNDGIRQLEVAVAMDSKVSLYRSYLGKAYLETGDLRLAEKQLELAKKLDPNDPTPWLYDALRTRAEGNPVGALVAIERSRALNKKRSVYRSRLLLDSDDAIRSVGQGAIYEDLGFEQLTIPSISQSLAANPNNHSAHRALAEVYGNRPRREIARVSETLQAQVRQPLALTGVDPRLGESRLFQSDPSPAITPSFSEYSRLFSSEGAQGFWATRIASNNTFENQLGASLLHGPVLIDASFFSLDTEGYRVNNERTQDYWNVLLQGQIDSGTQIQFEYRTIDDNYGEPLIRYDIDDFFIHADTTLDIRSWRVSMSHEIRPGWDIAALVRGESATRQFAWQAGFFDQLVDEDGHQVEVQLTGATKRATFVAGGSHFSSNRLNEQVTVFPLSLSVPSYSKHSSPEHINTYAYHHTQLPGDRSFVTLGASYDQVKDGFSDDNQYELNPKAGLVWRLADLPWRIEPTIRLAYVETLKRALLANQTLEPTTVAGFSQFFDDGEGAKSRVKGAALDLAIPDSNLEFGLSWSQRRIDVPNLDFVTATVAHSDARESEFSAHAYWHNGKDLSASLLYRQESFERDVRGPEYFLDMEIDRVELELNYAIKPPGLANKVALSFAPKWLRQSGIFVNAGEAPMPEEESEGIVVDAAIKYPLPSRAGHISLSIRNLFDERFNFQDTDPFNPRIAPERVISLSGVFHVDL